MDSSYGATGFPGRVRVQKRRRTLVTQLGVNHAHAANSRYVLRSSHMYRCILVNRDPFRCAEIGSSESMDRCADSADSQFADTNVLPI